MEEVPDGSKMTIETNTIEALEKEMNDLTVEIDKLKRDYIISRLNIKHLNEIRNKLQSAAEKIILEEAEEIEDTIEIEESEEDEENEDTSDSIKTDSDFSVVEDITGSDHEEKQATRRPTTRQSSTINSTKKESQGVITRSRTKHTIEELKPAEDNETSSEINPPVYDDAKLLVSLSRSLSQNKEQVPPSETPSETPSIPDIPSAMPLIYNNPTTGVIPPSLLEILQTKQQPKTFQNLANIIPPLSQGSGSAKETDLSKVSQVKLQQVQQVQQVQTQQTQQTQQAPIQIQPVQPQPRPALPKSANETPQFNPKTPSTPLSSGMMYNMYSAPAPIYPQLNQNPSMRAQPNGIYTLKPVQPTQPAQPPQPTKRPQPYPEMNRMYVPGYDYAYQPMMNAPYTPQSRMMNNRGMMMNGFYPNPQSYMMDMNGQAIYPQAIYPQPYSGVMANPAEAKGMPAKVGKVEGMNSVNMPMMSVQGLPPMGMNQDMQGKPFFIPTIAADKDGKIMPTV